MSGPRNRPLLVTDCDEVLLHMVRHFGEWLGEVHGMEFVLDGDPFAQPMTPKGAAQPLSTPCLIGLALALIGLLAVI